MSDFNPQERVKKMVAAIKNEVNIYFAVISFQAKEKAEQIMDNAAQQFKIEKNKLINQAKEKIKEENNKRKEAHEIQTRIERSSKINKCRLDKMNVRFELLSKLKMEIKDQLSNKITNQALYRELMKQLILQGMIKLIESKVELKCLERDIDLVNSLIKECEEQYHRVMQEGTGRQYETKLSLNTYHFLDGEGQKCLGGIVLTCNDRKTVCANTLDERLELCFQEFLPDIRQGLFGDGKKNN